MSNPPSSPATIVGRYTCVPLPPTTNPPLPGLAYAVERSDGVVFFLTERDRWSVQDRAWAGMQPSLGETLAVSGVISERRDLRGETYRLIEVERAGRVS